MIDYALSKTPEWLIFSISFEGISSQEYLEESSFCANFLELLQLQMIEKEEKELADF